MRLGRLFLIGALLLLAAGQSEGKKKGSGKSAVSDKSEEPSAVDRKAAKSHIKVQAKAPPPTVPTSLNDDDNTIEDVDEDKIDEILRDATRNLVIFFYDGRAACPSCSEALSEVEEIDDDIEATGYVQVVKTDDRSVARELGINTFPALVYFRRKNPILYDGDFKDSEVVLRWLRSHEEVATWDLTDENFESRTDSHSPDEGNLDWFVMLFHRGKMYRYKETARDVRSLTNFALFKFKEQRGHRVPDPPSAIERVYELVKERALDALDDNQTLSVLGVGGLLLMVAITLIIKAYRIKHTEKKSA